MLRYASSIKGALHPNLRILTLNISKTILITNIFVPFFHCLTLNSFNGKRFDFTGRKFGWGNTLLFTFCFVLAASNLRTVFARFVARALIFFNQTHYRALIQTGRYSSTGACYFQSKIINKNYR